MYTIKQAAVRTGVPIELLRAWERRYGIVSPERTPAGYRLYDDASLERVRAMRRLIGEGWSPSVAAAAILRGDAPATPSTGDDRQGPEPAVAAPTSGLVEAFVAAAADLDPAAVESVLDAIFAAGSFELVADRLLLPALTALGDAWAAGRVGVAEEHAASHAVLRRLAAAFQAAGRAAKTSRSAVIALPPGCRHELAALTFAVAARRAGLPVLYLGPDLPVDDWAAAVRNASARAAVIGAPTAGDVQAAARVAAAVRDARPRIVVAFGGRGGEAAAQADGGPAPLVLPDSIGQAVDALAAAMQRRR